MERLCECGHPEKDHDEPDRLHYCRHEDCTCTEFVWDGDLGGAAVTRSK